MLSNNSIEVNANDLNNSKPQQPYPEKEEFLNGQQVNFSTEADRKRFIGLRRQFSNYGLVNVSGRTFIVKPTVKDGRDNFDFSSVRDFHDFHAPDTFNILEELPNGGTVVRTKRFSHVWFQAKELCRRYDNVTFNLDPTDQNPNEFNYWRGFIAPVAGDATPFVSHIERLLVNESGAFVESRYVLDLMAWVVQNPHVNPAILLLLLGPQGTGKSTVLETLRSFCPSNTTATSYLEGFLKWNGHTANCKFIGLEEAFSNGNYLVQQRIKDMVTCTFRNIECKGKDIYQVKNCVLYIGTSNSDRPFAIDEDDRRTAVFMTQKAGDKAYFDKYYDWLHNGGAAHALHYLLNVNLNGFDHKAIPNTTARASLKVNSLSPLDSFLHSFLTGHFDHDLDLTWPDEGKTVNVDRARLYELYRSQCTAYSDDIRKFSAQLSKVFDFPKGWADNWRTSKSRGGGSHYRFACQAAAKTQFATYLKSDIANIFD